MIRHSGPTTETKWYRGQNTQLQLLERTIHFDGRIKISLIGKKVKKNKGNGPTSTKQRMRKEKSISFHNGKTIRK
ncbi:hypothetical protein AYI68_g3827 [Smittium mucronatum]|uniref:Uncharacterized protein n=1 Tax=Smittium mucronatum TaxID=133383 RepID=A0A1R0GYV0_9FUNG|nr:hypothetical protein AYI68_g3827 [Smittium mucronatum]